VETVGGGGGGVVLLHAAIDFQGRPSCQAVIDVVLWFVVVGTLTGVASLVGTVGSCQLVQGVTGRLVVLFAAANGWSSGRLVRWSSGRAVGCRLVVFVALVVVVALVVWLKGSCRVAALVSLVVFLVSMFAAVVVVAIQEVFVVVAAAIVVLVLAVVVFLAVLVVVRHQ
jgi:hypothetical protein